MSKKSETPFPSPDQLFFSVHAVIGVLERGQFFFVDPSGRPRHEFGEMVDLRSVIRVYTAAFGSRVPKTREGELILTALRKAARESSSSLHSWEWAVSALSVFADGPKAPVVEIGRRKGRKERVIVEDPYNARDELVIYLSFLRKTLLEVTKRLE